MNEKETFESLYKVLEDDYNANKDTLKELIRALYVKAYREGYKKCKEDRFRKDYES